MSRKKTVGRAGAVGVALCLFAAAASADWGLTYEVSPNGISWGPAIVVAPGGTVYFRMGVYFDPGTQVSTSGGNGNAVVFGRVAGQQIITNTITGQDIASEVTRLVPAGSGLFLSVSNTASGILIGSGNPASWAAYLVLSGSLPFYIENPQFSASIFMGKLAIGASTTPRTFTFRNNIFGTSNEPGLRFYNDVPISPVEFGAPINSSDRADVNATIQVSTASCSPPTINSISGTTTVAPSQAATFTVSASNAAFYEWLKDGKVMTVGTALGVGTATMTIAYPNSLSAGSYRVRVYSLCGATSLSTPIELSVICEADFNGDGLVDDADFAFFIRFYESLLCDGPIYCTPDFNIDGIVDDADFIVFAAQYDQLICP